MIQRQQPETLQQLRTENRLLTEEVYTARRAAELTAELVVDEIRRMEEVRRELEEKNNELRKALDEIDTLRDTLPICASCKSIRDDAGYWQKIESYLKEHSGTELTHGICPECEETMYGDQPWYQKLKKERAEKSARNNQSSY